METNLLKSVLEEKREHLGQSLITNPKEASVPKVLLVDLNILHKSHLGAQNQHAVVRLSVISPSTAPVLEISEA
jgi:hypothetical protein